MSVSWVRSRRESDATGCENLLTVPYAGRVAARRANWPLSTLSKWSREFLLQFVNNRVVDFFEFSIILHSRRPIYNELTTI